MIATYQRETVEGNAYQSPLMSDLPGVFEGPLPAAADANVEGTIAKGSYAKASTFRVDERSSET